MFKKPFQVYWSSTGLIEDHESFVGVVDTDDPVRAEQQYFKLCKKQLGKDGFVFVLSTDHELVPPARFNTAKGIRWNADREQQDVRRWVVWSMPEEIPYKRWRAPTAYMIKGLKSVVLLKSGEQVGCEISGERIAKVLGRSSRGIRYWISESDDVRKIDYSSWRLLTELAGFKVKPIDKFL